MMEKQLIPAGYKQTEVGVIPEDWETKKLGEIGQFKNGINKDAESFGHGTPFVNLMDVFGKPAINGHENFGLLDATENDLKEYGLKKGDVLFIRSSVKPSGVGLTSVIKADLADTVYSGFLIRYRSNDLLDIGFKEHCFYQSGFRKRIIAASSVSANTNINQESLKDIVLVIPTFTEQTAIANALSDIDALIAALEKLINKKSAIKTAAMQQLLTGKKRLPPFDQLNTGYKQTELGEIPGDWEVNALANTCSMKSGAGITSEGISDSGKYPCYGGNGLRGYTQSFTHDGDFALIGRQGALCGNVVSAKGQFFASEHAIVVTPHQKTNIEWLAYILYRMNLNQYSESSAQPGLSVSKLLVFKIICPSLKEQTAIANVLSDMDKDLDALQQRLHKTQHIKQGMMQELLTGKTRFV